MSCKVEGCENSYHEKNRDGLQISFHRFPSTDEVRCQQWIDAAGCDALPTKTWAAKSVICSEHFAESAFRLQDILLKVPIEKRRLNEKAVPTLKLPGTSTGARLKKAWAKERQVLVANIMKTHEQGKIKERQEKFQAKETQTTKPLPVIVETNATILSKHVNSLAWKVGQQQAEIFNLRRQLVRFRQFFKEEEADLIAKGEMVPKSDAEELCKLEMGGDEMMAEDEDDDGEPIGEGIDVNIEEIFFPENSKDGDEGHGGFYDEGDTMDQEEDEDYENN